MIRHRIPAIVTTLVLVLAATLAVPVHAGLYYKSKTTSDARRGGPPEYDVEGWVDGANAKVAFESSSDRIFSRGSYLLAREGETAVYLVKPDEKTYSKLDFDELFSTLGNMMQATGGLVDFDFKDASGEKVSEEPGPSILGHSTQHVQWKTGYTLELKIMGMKRENRVDAVTDAWMTQDFQAPGLGLWLRARPPTSGDEDLDKVLRTAFQSVHGFPLKMVIATTTTDKKGRQQRTTQTMEVGEIREQSVPASTFELPEGYTEKPLLPQMQQQDQEKSSPLKGLFGGKGG